MNVLIILAEGFEDVEAVTPIDVLRRAQVEVTVAGLKPGAVKGARGVVVQPDTTLDAVKDKEFDALVLPGGGKGAENLGASEIVKQLVLKFNREKKIVAAICAAPAVVLAPTGILDGKNATCFPGMEDHFSKAIKFKTDLVVVDGNIITSRAMGTALAFSLELVKQLCGAEMTEKIRKSVLA